MNNNSSFTFRQSTFFAAILVFVGAVCFSTKAVFVKLAYQYDVDSISLLALRMAFSLPIFLSIAWWSNRDTQNKDYKMQSKDWFYTLLLGAMGYYLASLLDFLGLQYVTAGMERLILFTYPTLVVLISVLFLKKKILKIHYIALTLTYIGIGMAFFEYLQSDAHSIFDVNNQFMFGAILIFGAALAYAVYLVGSGNLLPRLGTVRYNSLSMSAAGMAVLIHHAITNQLALFNFVPEVYYYGMAMALVSTVIPSFLIAEGIRIIGATNASIIGSVGPISTIILAYIFLGERLGWWQWGGTLLVIVGVLLISLQKGKSGNAQ